MSNFVISNYFLFFRRNYSAFTLITGNNYFNRFL